MRSLTTLTTRRWVTGISVFILLLCQTVAAALAYAMPMAISAATASAQSSALDDALPCHDAKNTGSTMPSNGCHDRCPSRDATFESAKINIPAAANLASPVFIVDAPHSIAAARARYYEPIAANAAPPPPLRLVYCRLLN